MELILAGLGILFLLFAWNCAFLPALRGRCIDHLQDRREEVSAFFANNPSPDRMRVRRALESLLSTQIANIDRVSIIGFMIFSHWHKKRPEAFDEFDEDIVARFASNDRQVTEFADRIRSEAALALFSYMGRKYSLLWLMAIVVVPCIALNKGYKALWQAADAVARELVRASGAEVEPAETKRILEDSIFAMSH